MCRSHTLPTSTAARAPANKSACFLVINLQADPVARPDHCFQQGSGVAGLHGLAVCQFRSRSDASSQELQFDPRRSKWGIAPTGPDPTGDAAEPPSCRRCGNPDRPASQHLGEHKARAGTDAGTWPGRRADQVERSCSATTQRPAEGENSGRGGGCLTGCHRRLGSGSPARGRAARARRDPKSCPRGPAHSARSTRALAPHKAPSPRPSGARRSLRRRRRGSCPAGCAPAPRTRGALAAPGTDRWRSAGRRLGQARPEEGRTWLAHRSPP